jgi:uncharacterized membrane protein YvbJ
MPRQLLNNKIINNKKSMRREFIFPMVMGLIIGALIMIFFQFNARLNNATVALGQLEQASSQNTKTVNDVVAFINQATGANKQAANGAGAATDTTSPSTK